MDYDKQVLDLCERIIAVSATKGDPRPLQVALKRLLDEKERKEADARTEG